MNSPKVVNLDNLRMAAATARALGAWNGNYPYYIHKWTRQKRLYSADDLSLPKTLFFRGNWPPKNAFFVGVGGTRSPSVETFCLASAVTRELTKSDVTIISGGVPGVDLAAHLSAIDGQCGSTIAVLANPVAMGLRGHEWSCDEVEAGIVNNGGFVSEYPEACSVGSPEFCERLLARDRIISGLSDTFLVFECSEDSATIDTARRALVQGKQVICIDSTRRTVRRGIDQIASEFSVPVLDERSATPREIAAEVLRTLDLGDVCFAPAEN